VVVRKVQSLERKGCAAVAPSVAVVTTVAVVALTASMSTPDALTAPVRVSWGWVVGVVGVGLG
jgi:hypothetical protein